jgi:threonine/homoserine/homoserine lactone efflux protein
MVCTTALIGMALVAFGVVITPGPNMIYLVSRSIGQGWQAGMVSLLGTFVGFMVYMTMANVGLATVFVLVPWLYVGIKLIGSAYLLYLAWKAFKPGGVSLFEVQRLCRQSRARLFGMGLLTNLLNPKAAIMYLALIPQFIRPAAGHVMAQGFILGGIQITVSMIVNALIIVAAGAIAAFLGTRPSWTKWQRWVTGTLLGTVGVKLALEAPATARP